LYELLGFDKVFERFGKAFLMFGMVYKVFKRFGEVF
jgi:hypothetical protein